MRIFDINDIEITSPDISKGWLKEDRMFVMHHEAMDAIPEQGHYETIKEYPNGGKDVEWIVDIPGVAAQDAYDEYEGILRFIPFTDKELADRRIVELKGLLQDSDYHILKIVEGVSTISDCTDIIAKRAAWRKEINELEETLNI